MNKDKIAFIAEAPLLRGNATFLKKILKWTKDDDCNPILREKIDYLCALEQLMIKRIGNIIPVDCIDVTAKGEDNFSIQDKYTSKAKESIERNECVVVLDRDMLNLSSLSDEELEKIYFLDITRTNDGKFTNKFGAKQLEEQFNTLINNERVCKAQKIVFVDDVLFTGSTVIYVKEELKKIIFASGMKPKRFTSIFALSLVEENGKEKLRNEGIESEVISEQSGYIDLVDGRDLCYGFKNSGKASPEGNKSYFKPVGNPKCASIPEESHDEFSEVCAIYSKKFWEEIDPSMTASKYIGLEIGGKPFIPQGFTENSEFVKILEKIIQDIRKPNLENIS
jgi:hypothetical protein